jgi:hypothetical protein
MQMSDSPIIRLAALARETVTGTISIDPPRLRAQATTV